MSGTQLKLFQPIQIGNLLLKHRVVLAPLTRWRTDGNHTPLVPLVSEYYSQRARVPGTLLITEATLVAPIAGGDKFAPGIWSDDQISAWKKIVGGVHAKGSIIFLQLWALGRAGDPEQLEEESLPYVSASDVKLNGKSKPPRPLTTEEIAEYVQLYAAAASNAVDKAGFDGVEIHDANGYLIDEFIQDVTNKRTDEYGGSPEKRARFPLEVLDAVTKAVGSKKTAVRLSPWSPFQGKISRAGFLCSDSFDSYALFRHGSNMGEADPKISFSYLVTQLRDSYPDLAYLHVIEPSIKGNEDVSAEDHASNDFIREIWGPRPIINAGGFDRKKAIDITESVPNSLVAFGRYFIANPDLPRRLMEDIPLNPYNPDTFYRPGSTESLGYTDQPFADTA